MQTKNIQKESMEQPSESVMHTRKSFNFIDSKNNTASSIKYRTLKQKQKALKLTWEIKGQCQVYLLTLKNCKIWLNEELGIINYPDKNLLKKRSEGVSQCCH